MNGLLQKTVFVIDRIIREDVRIPIGNERVQVGVRQMLAKIFKATAPSDRRWAHINHSSVRRDMAAWMARMRCQGYTVTAVSRNGSFRRARYHASKKVYKLEPIYALRPIFETRQIHRIERDYVAELRGIVEGNVHSITLNPPKMGINYEVSHDKVLKPEVSFEFLNIIYNHQSFFITDIRLERNMILKALVIEQAHLGTIVDNAYKKTLSDMKVQNTANMQDVYVKNFSEFLDKSHRTIKINTNVLSMHAKIRLMSQLDYVSHSFSYYLLGKIFSGELWEVEFYKPEIAIEYLTKVPANKHYSEDSLECLLNVSLNTSNNRAKLLAIESLSAKRNRLGLFFKRVSKSSVSSELYSPYLRSPLIDKTRVDPCHEKAIVVYKENSLNR